MSVQDIIALRLEKAQADLARNTANYGANNKIALSGTQPRSAVAIRHMAHLRAKKRHDGMDRSRIKAERMDRQRLERRGDDLTFELRA